MRYLSINQTQVFTHILASTFRRLRHIFFLLRVVRKSSSQTRRVLKVLREHLLAVTTGRIAVVGTKVFESPPLSIARSNRLARPNV